jgi:CO/xanthine dehydrogenase FAD-binding subunit
MEDFDYSAPINLQEAATLLARLDGNSIIMAGGTDVIPLIHTHRLLPCHIVDIKSITELSLITETNEGLRIGAAVHVNDLICNSLIRNKYPALTNAAAVLGSFPVRCLATIGGNVCHASPAGDLLPPLLLYNGVATLYSIRGWRIVSLDDFFVGPGKTVILNDEILVDLFLPLQNNNYRSTYVKHGPRNAMDIATVGIAIGAEYITGRDAEIRIALGAVGPKPFRAKKAEQIWNEQGIRSWKEVGILASNECLPIDDFRASANYRRLVVRVQVARLLEQLVEIH